jgi:hypothetical protein
MNFGTFGVSKRKARKARTPQIGEIIKIATKKVPVFKAGKGLKDAVEYTDNMPSQGLLAEPSHSPTGRLFFISNSNSNFDYSSHV